MTHTPTRRQREWRWLQCAAAAIVVLLAGCSDPDDRAEDDSAFTIFMDQELERVKDADVSEEQIAILKDALSDGELTLEHVEEAVSLTFACFDQSEIPNGWEADHEADGVIVKSYWYSGPPGDSTPDGPWLAVADECIRANSLYVEQAYLYQPASREAQEAYWSENLRLPILECLKGHGVDVDSDASRSEIEEAAITLMRESWEWTTEPDPQYDCFYQAGQ